MFFPCNYIYIDVSAKIISPPPGTRRQVLQVIHIGKSNLSPLYCAFVFMLSAMFGQFPVIVISAENRSPRIYDK